MRRVLALRTGARRGRLAAGGLALAVSISLLPFSLLAFSLLALRAGEAQAEPALGNVPRIPYEAGAREPTSGWLASTLLRAAVSSKADPEEDAGTVEDIVIGPDARVRSVLISAGAHLGVGAMIFSIPWNQVVFSADESHLVMDQEKVDLAPYSPVGPIDELDRGEIDQIVRFEGGGVTTGAGLYKVSDLLKGKAPDALGPVPGSVADLAIDPGGFVRAVIFVPPGASAPHRLHAPFFGLFDGTGRRG